MVEKPPFLVILFMLFVAAESAVSEALAANLQRGVCVDRSYRVFSELVTRQNPQEIVFFASWCVGCRKHIVESNPLDTVYVISFDETEAAQKALFSQFPKEKWPSIWCETDIKGEIKRKYQVSQLPKTIKVLP